MKLELVLDDRSLPWLPSDATRRGLERLLGELGPEAARLQVVCTDDETLREHNRHYRERDRSTDVLSFSYLDNPVPRRQALLEGRLGPDQLSSDPGFEDDPLAGQLLISVETLRRRGAVHASDLEAEWVFMVVHGALHVLGYDHATEEDALEMEGHERRIMGRFVPETPRADDGSNARGTRGT